MEEDEIEEVVDRIPLTLSLSPLGREEGEGPLVKKLNVFVLPQLSQKIVPPPTVGEDSGGG
jgi:hypothetical protein